MVTCSSLPSTSQPALAAGDDRDPLRRGVDARWCRRPAATTSSSDIGNGESRGSSPCRRESSMTCWTSRVRRSLSVTIRSEKRRTASGSSAASLDGVGQQPDRADRGLELVAHVGHEVAAHGLDPALAGAVLDERQHQPGAERGDPHGDVPGRRVGAGHHQLGLADLPVASDLADQRGQLVGGQRGATHQRHRVRRGGGLQHDVGVVDDDGAAAEHGQHGGHRRGDGRLLRHGCLVLLAVADVPGQHGSSSDAGPDQRGEERLHRGSTSRIVRPSPGEPHFARV